MDMMRMTKKFSISTGTSKPVVSGKARMYIRNVLEVAIQDKPAEVLVVVDTPNGQMLIDLMPDGTYKVHVPGTPGSQWKDQIELKDLGR